MPGIPARRLEPTGGPQLVTITPELATQLLERNNVNRPLSDMHVQRLANQIRSGKWKFNGDTIKLSDTEDVLDGQHRLWAIIDAQKSVETIIVYGIERDAFATIDTLRRARTGSDVIALAGQSRHRQHVSSALQWMIRWQRGILMEYLAPANRVENSDIEEAFAAHPKIVQAIERSAQLRTIANPAILGFLYYVITNRNAPLAERMMRTLEDPASIGVNDPFFRLRIHFTTDRWRRKEPVMTIAVAIKAANAAFRGDEVRSLQWRNQGSSAESFPVLAVDESARRPSRRPLAEAHS